MRKTLLNSPWCSRTALRISFTLVELLIVISIIVILMGLLLPALKSARNQVKSIQCVNNLKNMGTGIQLYIGDYNDYYPVKPTDNTKIGLCWDAAIASYVNIKLNYYLLYSLYWCPASGSCPSGSSTLGRTYAANYYFGRNATGNTDRNIIKSSVLRNTSKIGVLYELPHMKIFGSWASHLEYFGGLSGFDTILNDQMHFWHNNKMNVLFLDWHVESRSFSQMQGSGNLYFY